jgi:hypothetical protein
VAQSYGTQPLMDDDTYGNANSASAVAARTYGVAVGQEPVCCCLFVCLFVRSFVCLFV